jgi:hypothetical protein
MTLIFKYILNYLQIYILRKLFSFLLFGFYMFRLIVVLFSYMLKSQLFYIIYLVIKYVPTYFNDFC